MSGRTRRDRKLRVEKTTLRTLDKKDLDKAAGGAKGAAFDDYGTSRGRGTVGASA